MGRFGEEVAASFLARRGARLLGRNVRTGRGEIDLHVRIGSSVLAVEVKTVDGRYGNRAEHQFTARKAAAVASAASRLRPRPDRVDLVEVVVYSARVDVRWTKAVA